MTEDNLVTPDGERTLRTAVQIVKYGGLVMSLLVAGGCMFSSPQRKRIVGGYCLERDPSERFNVVGCSFRAKLHGRTDNGPMDGHVLRVGWDDRLIAAQRKAVVGGSVAWMILDTKAETLEGPFSDEELRERARTLPRLAAIKMANAEDAWLALP
jgi:hypothetical protein